MRPALFLDRDGVVNYDDGYTHIWRDDLLIDGVADLIRCFKRLNYLIIIVTNQSGIGRGLYSEQVFKVFMRDLQTSLMSQDAIYDAYYFCKCTPKEPICFRRKPNAGMFLEAIADFDVDIEKSVMVGDKVSDMEAAAAANVKHRYLYCVRGDKRKWIGEKMKFEVVRSLGDIFPSWIRCT